MQITNIECIPVQAPGRTLVPILVETDEGITGVGEAGLQRRWMGIKGIVEHFNKWLVGEDPDRIEYLWQKMFRGGFYPADKLIGSVIAGIDIALWDIKGKKMGVPAYQLLGGRCRDYVRCFTNQTYIPAVGKNFPESISHRDEQQDKRMEFWIELVKKSVKNKHKYFRITLPGKENFFEPKEEVYKLIDILKNIRETVGNSIELMVDLHARLDPPTALLFCKRVEELDLFVVEDPIRSEFIQGYRNIRNKTCVPLAAGEQWANKWEFKQCIEEELIDYARIDVAIAGGITEAKKIAGMAETHNIKLLLHNPLGPINTAASLHLDLCCDNAGPQEVQFPPETMLPDVFNCSFVFKDEKLSLPEGEGIGVTFDKAKALSYKAEFTEPPHFHLEDGSFTNY